MPRWQISPNKITRNRTGNEKGLRRTIFRPSKKVYPAKPTPPIPEIPVFVPFSLNVGDSGDWIGYSSGDMASPPFNPPVGTISNQPHADYTVLAVYPDDSVGAASLVVVFQGSKAMGAESTIQINGSIPARIQAVVHQYGNTFVHFEYLGSFIDGQTYAVLLSY